MQRRSSKRNGSQRGIDHCDRHPSLAEDSKLMNPVYSCLKQRLQCGRKGLLYLRNRRVGSNTEHDIERAALKIRLRTGVVFNIDDSEFRLRRFRNALECWPKGLSGRASQSNDNFLIWLSKPRRDDYQRNDEHRRNRCHDQSHAAPQPLDDLSFRNQSSGPYPVQGDTNVR